jgi:hypothetical protein
VVLQGVAALVIVIHCHRRGVRCVQVQGRVDKCAKIIELNDRLRSTFKGGRLQFTRNCFELDAGLRGRAAYVMSKYNRFDESSEHDWGVFIFAGYSFEWRIEYRSPDGAGVSSDPSDSEKTLRILTLYVADDVLR